MLNREQFIETLNKACEELGFEKSDVVISHGGASLLQHLRNETDDIDVSIPQHYWDVLLDLGLEVRTLPATGTYPAVDIIEYLDVDWHLATKDQSADMVNLHGYAVTRPLRLLRDRIALGRQKDMGDIKLLTHLASQLSMKDYARMNELINQHL